MSLLLSYVFEIRPYEANTAITATSATSATSVTSATTASTAAAATSDSSLLLLAINDSLGSDKDRETSSGTDANVVSSSHDAPVAVAANAIAVDVHSSSTMMTVGGGNDGGSGSSSIGAGSSSIGSSSGGGVSDTNGSDGTDIMDCGDVMELVTLCHQISLDEGLYRNHTTGDTLGHRAAMLLHLWVTNKTLNPTHPPSDHTIYFIKPNNRTHSLIL